MNQSVAEHAKLSQGWLMTIITSLKEFGEKIEAYATLPKHEVRWYRGIGNANYELIPSLYRHSKIGEKEPLKFENDLLVRFKQRSIPYLTRDPVDDWEVLFLMQHYGVPTRLLDFTENPYIGLFFALTSSHEKMGVRPDAAMWCVDPVKWNQAALDHISYRDGVLVKQDERISGYKPGALPIVFPKYPVAIYGSYNSPRIAAQKGAFMIFGSEVAPMESVINSISAESGILEKITIPSASVEQVLDSLTAVGYTDSVLFPDLEGLAREIRRAHGF